jgi:hypothetical protein
VLFCVLCHTVVPLPLGKNPFAVQLNNSNTKCYIEEKDLSVRTINCVRRKNPWFKSYNLCESFGVYLNNFQQIISYTRS